MKYFICFPQGGINDMLSRIQECIVYCVREQRLLVLDTTKNWFREEWRTYFALNHHVMYQGDTPAFITYLLTQEVYPPCLQNRTYESLPDAVWVRPGHMEMDEMVVSTPLNVSYPHKVVCYADCGSSIHINPILSIMTFSNRIKSEFHRRRALLPDTYISVHLRNTDYTSNIEAFLDENDEVLVHHDLFIATDHYATLERVRERYGERVYSFASLPHLPDGVNIHESRNAQNLRSTKELQDNFLIDMFTDFLLLAHGSQCLTSNTRSGFSRSVRYLHQLPSLAHSLVKSI